MPTSKMPHLSLPPAIDRPASGAVIAARRRSLPWGRVLGSVAAVAALTATAQQGQQIGFQQMSAWDRNRTMILSAANRFPDANDQALMLQQAAEQRRFEAINAMRRKQLSDESATLLKLAADLKIEMDKTDKDTLNLNVIRKADQIQKLAEDMKKTMKLTVGQG